MRTSGLRISYSLQCIQHAAHFVMHYFIAKITGPVRLGMLDGHGVGFAAVPALTGAAAGSLGLAALRTLHSAWGCPMDINIPAYTDCSRRVLSTECTLCQTCISACPTEALRLSVGFDMGGEENFRMKELVH
jgi:hypothetical protein